MRSIAHIINPVSAADNAELFRIQEITFTSIVNAKEYSKGRVDVKTYVTQYEDAQSIAPADFKMLANLNRSVSDISAFKIPRKLPLIKDILDMLYANTDAEYLIYTNLDICLMPQFYLTVNDYINNGCDAFVINRRRISGNYNSPSQLEQMYSEIGKEHTGYDTFVFKRTHYEKFIMKNMCLGIPLVGNDLFYNIFCFAENPKLFTDKHLTFHIGMELYKEWGDDEHNKHNQQEFLFLMKDVAPFIDITKFPGANLNLFSRHFKWLMNPTFHYPTMFIADLKQLGKKRRPAEKERKTMKQRYVEWLLKRINFD